MQRYGNCHIARTREVRITNVPYPVSITISLASIGIDRTVIVTVGCTISITIGVGDQTTTLTRIDLGRIAGAEIITVRGAITIGVDIGDAAATDPTVGCREC